VAGGTVLVVEDEGEVRAQIVEVLSDLGCRVVQAQDGPSGLRMVQSLERLDMLVTDVGMPGLNGRQLADAARESRPGLPVLLITGYAGTALEDRALPQGIEVMRKPFALDALAARVGAMLEVACATR
jgi:CheY-like chemotaxis protein